MAGIVGYVAYTGTVIQLVGLQGLLNLCLMIQSGQDVRGLNCH